MSWKRSALAGTVSALIVTLAGQFAFSAGPPLPGLESGFAAINGNVPEVQYDNQDRLYTQIVLPNGGSQLSQEVLQAFGADQTLRGQTVVRVNYADNDFQYRFGNAFVEAYQGYPTVALMHEQGGQTRCVWKQPIGSSNEIGPALGSCRAAVIDLHIQGPNCPTCPNCPKPGPQPSPLKQPGPSANPTLPPLANTTTPGTTDDDVNTTLVLGVAAAIGVIVFIGMGVLRTDMS